MDTYCRENMADTLKLCLETVPELIKATVELTKLHNTIAIDIAAQGPEQTTQQNNNNNTIQQTRGALKEKVKREAERLIAACEISASLLGKVKSQRRNSKSGSWRSLAQAASDKVNEALADAEDVHSHHNNTHPITPAKKIKESHSSSSTIVSRCQPLSSDALWHIALSVPDMPTLRSMCLVTPSWHAATLPRLWSYIGLVHSNYAQLSSRLVKLATVLRGNPALGGLIREFELSMTRLEGDENSDGENDEDDDDSMDSDANFSAGRMTHDTMVTKNVAALLSNIETLHLRIDQLHMFDGFFDQRSESLRHLDLGSSPLDDSLLTQAASAFPNLQELFLRDCSEITPVGFATLVKSCPRLRAVGMNGCELLGDESLITLVSSCPKLEKVAVGYRQTMTDASIVHLATSAPNLTALFLDGRDTLSEPPLLQLIHNVGPNLVSLSLSYCDITDVLVQEIAMTCTQLKGLALAGCSAGKVTDMSIRAVVELCGKLKMLALDGNEGFSAALEHEVLERFGEDVPSITKEFMYYRKWSGVDG